MIVKVFCPICGKRILDVINSASGEISTKCRHCNKVVEIRFDDIVGNSGLKDNK